MKFGTNSLSIYIGLFLSIVMLYGFLGIALDKYQVATAPPPTIPVIDKKDALGEDNRILSYEGLSKDEVGYFIIAIKFTSDSVTFNPVWNGTAIDKSCKVDFDHINTADRIFLKIDSVTCGNLYTPLNGIVHGSDGKKGLRVEDTGNVSEKDYVAFVILTPINKNNFLTDNVN